MKRLYLFLILVLTAMTVSAENRVALLIANGKYKNFSSLTGPTNEAEALSTTLKSLGFDVKLLENATREQMLDELDNLKSRVNGKGGIAFFHYGGHGVQVNGSNYLIPIDADIPDERKVATRAVVIDEVMSSLDSCGSDSNIIILDACRNNPLPAGTGRSATRGLTVVGTKPKNSIIVYSAEAGTVAQDGLFTPTLTKLITQNGKSLNQILMQLRKEVSSKSNGSQIPGEYNQLFDDIFLNGKITEIANSNTQIPQDINLSINNSLFEKIISSYKYNKIVYQTNFADENSFNLILRENQKIDPRKDYATVYGTTEISGGALICLPFALNYRNRVIIEFESQESYEFGFSVNERLDQQQEANSLMIKQTGNNLQAESWPWKRINNNWKTEGIGLSWKSSQFRYEPKKKYMVVIEIDSNGSTTASIINENNKRNMVISPFNFKNIPIEFFIRSFKGQARFYNLIVEEF